MLVKECDLNGVSGSTWGYDREPVVEMENCNMQQVQYINPYKLIQHLCIPIFIHLSIHLFI